MSTKAFLGVAILWTVGSLFIGCGDGDGITVSTCSPRKVTCLNDKSGEICSSDGSVMLPFTCDEGEVCGTDAEKTGCIGSCNPGEKECASEAISRVCAADGKAWIPVACAPGTGCDNDPEDDDEVPTFGTCVRTDDPTVTVCDAEEVTCADDRTVKACEQDGSNWIYAPCGDNEACMDGECVVDPGKRCTPNSGTCVDATHVRKCADDGLSYEEPEACPGETTCSDGACRGPVCTVGEVRCDDVRDGNVFTALAQGTYQARAVYRCREGVAWDVTQCAQSDVCAYTDISSTAVNRYIEDLKTALQLGGNDLPVFDVPESSRAECQTPQCAAPFALRELLSESPYDDGAFFGSYACGDPTAADPSFIESFSLCEGLPPYNNLHWANYACPDGTECSYVENVAQPNGTMQAPVCRSTCTSGDVRCFDEQGESIIRCVDGEWDLTTVDQCVSGTREQWCRRNVLGAGTNTTQASCQDPACVIWQDEFETFLVPPDYGACGDDGQFYECLPDGTMAAGRDCISCVRSVIRAPGIAPPSQEPSHFAGYPPGYCVEECSDGEQRCVSIGSPSSSPSPFYYQCDDGYWTTIASCPNGEACRDYPQTPESRREIFCGGVCFPGETACVDDQGDPGGKLLSTCDATGEWGAPVVCESGVCSEDDQTATGRAVCEDECIPGTKGCQGGAEVLCEDEARFGEPRACASGAACFAGTPSLSRLGCIECMPGDPTNPSQIPDSRCSGSTLEICGPRGTWNEMSATRCPAGCTGSQSGNTTPGQARASCLPITGEGGRGGGGQSGNGAAGGGAAGVSGAGGASGLGGQLG